MSNKKKAVDHYPEIQSYCNYRLFIRDYYQFKKYKLPGYSMTMMSVELGLSLSNLKMILTNKRNLTLANILQVSIGLKLSSQESQYFEFLVLQNQAVDETQQLYYAKKIEDLKNEFTLKKRKGSNEQLLEKWYFPALILYIIDVIQPESLVFDQNLFYILNQKFPVTMDDFHCIQRIFSDPEIASIGVDGKVNISFQKLRTPISYDKYLRQILEANLKNQKKSYVHTSAISIHQQNYKNFKSELKTLVEKYTQMDLGQKNENQVVQLTVQMTPF